MGKTQDHRNNTEQWLAVGGWQLVVGGGWRLVAISGLTAGGSWRQLVVGGWWQLVVSGPWGMSLRAVLNKKKMIRLLKDAHVVTLCHAMPQRFGLLTKNLDPCLRRCSQWV